MPSTTRTLGPLHFEDLEPHRFEDLVRQLVYDFRDWHSLEALGRKGRDEGIDIRGTERVKRRSIEDVNEEDKSDNWEYREWRIQCKREQEIGPSKLEDITDKLLKSHDRSCHGIIVSAPCDFSKQSRDVFRTILAKAGIEEFFLWGKAELEDLLFLPSNDHLLWAYFGISLRIRRKSLQSKVRSRLATKR